MAERHRWSVRLQLAMTALRAEGDGADEAEHALLEEAYRDVRRGWLPARAEEAERLLTRLLEEASRAQGDA